MALRPVSPVQLVTRALRIVWSTYHASAWHADRCRDMAATFGTGRAAASATGTELVGSSGTGVRYLRVRRMQGHPVGNSSDRTTFGEPRSSVPQ